MPAPIDQMDFHPDDPTKWLWKKLLRRGPVNFIAPKKTKAQRREISIKLQEYYAEHEHPRKGQPFQ